MMKIVIVLLATSTQGKISQKNPQRQKIGLFYGNRISNNLVGDGFNYDRRSLQAPTFSESLGELFFEILT